MKLTIDNQKGNKTICEWCGNETKLPRTYHSMCPFNEEFELLILEFEKKYGEKWWDSKEIEPILLEDILFYHQIVNTVSKGIVCADCLYKDDELYNKFKKK